MNKEELAEKIKEHGSMSAYLRSFGEFKSDIEGVLSVEDLSCVFELLKPYLEVGHGLEKELYPFDNDSFVKFSANVEIELVTDEMIKKMVLGDDK